MIHGLRRGFGLLVQLVTNIVQQGGLGDFRQGLRRLLTPPTGEVEQVVSISAEGPRRELPDALGIEESIGPGDFLPLLI